MELRNCIRCGKVFLYNGSPLCPSCRQEDEEDFKKVRDFLYKYPGSSLLEVSDGTGVSPDKIIRYLREGKLEISKDNDNIFLRCEMCGRPIKTGRFCEKCANEISTELKSGFVQEVKKEGNRQRDKDRLYIEERVKKKKE